MMKKVLLHIFLCLILVTAFVVPAFAYNLIGYEMIGGISSRYWSYYNPGGLSPEAGGYFTPIDNGVTSWNSSSTPAYFSPLPWNDPTSIQIYYVVADYGSTGWTGATQFYDEDDILINPNYEAPDEDWSYTIVKLNHYYLESRDDSQSLQSTTAHEMGHALGLLHVTDMATLMYPTIDRYDVEGVYTPQDDDEDGINAIY